MLVYCIIVLAEEGAEKEKVEEVEKTESESQMEKKVLSFKANI